MSVESISEENDDDGGIEESFMNEDIEESEQSKKEEEDSPKSLDAKIEEVARRQGWVPPEDRDGDGVDALTFLDRGKKFNDDMRLTIKDLKKQNAQMKIYLDEQKQIEEERASRNKEKELAALRMKKKDAIEEGDVEAVEKIDELIDKAKENFSSSPKPKEQSKPKENDSKAAAGYIDPEDQVFAKNWADNHPLYGEDDEVTTFANNIYDEYVARGLAPKTIIGLIDREIKKVFEDRVPKRKPRSPVLPGRQTVRWKQKTTIRDLNSAQRKALRDTQNEIPGFTAEEFIKDLIDSGDL